MSDYQQAATEVTECVLAFVEKPGGMPIPIRVKRHAITYRSRGIPDVQTVWGQDEVETLTGEPCFPVESDEHGPTEVLVHSMEPNTLMVRLVRIGEG